MIGISTPCVNDYDLFYSDDPDGRSEVGREEREALAGMLCADCPVMLRCLERALVNGEDYGVWGGMGEGERRKFKTMLVQDGYKRGEIPTGAELRSAVVHFYYYMATPAEKLHGESELEDIAS